jgi:meso-butanediol dehydrogenase / (S,S)-butanediol dehydrogenase / diacetyl reductase
MDLNLKGKVALITGAGSQTGMGKAIALTLAKEGCEVVITDIDQEGLNKTAAEIKAAGSKVLAIKTNITKKTEVEDMIAKALKQLKVIDILINAAGAGTPDKPFMAKSEEEWDMDINLNLKGAMYCIKATLPQMLARKSGKIVNISSVASKLCSPTASTYAAAKTGLIGFTRALAGEVAKAGVNVNAVSPGLTLTNFFKGGDPEKLKFFISMIPTGKANTAQDVANMVVFLASDVSANITGQNFSVDGGLTMN